MSDFDDLDSLVTLINEQSTTPSKEHEESKEDFSFDDLESFINDLEGDPCKRAVSTKKPNIKRKNKYTAEGAVSGNALEDLLSSIESHVEHISLHDKPKGTCFSCKKSIIGDVVVILGKTFHPEHVKCERCGTRNANNKYFDQDGIIWCGKCSDESKSIFCGKCNQKIIGYQIEEFGKFFHPDCFVCHTCSKPFKDGKFIAKGNNPICLNCSAAAYVCRICNNTIKDSAIEALGGFFHLDCFGCKVCRKPFGEGFYQADGVPYCEPHFIEKLKAEKQ